MKQRLFRFILPLTILLFGMITKWWFGIAIDAKDVFLYGFPFIHKTEGFHTSLSTQYFLVPMFANFCIYFIVIAVISTFWRIQISKIMARIFWVGFGIFMSIRIYYSTVVFNDVYLKNRDFEVEIFSTGISVFGQHERDRSQFKKQLEKHGNRNN